MIHSIHRYQSILNGFFHNLKIAFLHCCYHIHNILIIFKHYCDSF